MPDKKRWNGMKSMLKLSDGLPFFLRSVAWTDEVHFFEVLLASVGG